MPLKRYKDNKILSIRISDTKKKKQRTASFQTNTFNTKNYSSKGFILV